MAVLLCRVEQVLDAVRNCAGLAGRTRSARRGGAPSLGPAGNHWKTLQPELAPPGPRSPPRLLPVRVLAENVIGAVAKHWTPNAPGPWPCTVLPSRMCTAVSVLAWMPWLVALTIAAASRTR